MANLDEISDNFYQYSYKKYLSEMQNSDKPDEHHFPSKSAFYEDFSTKVNATYNDISRNYPPEVAKYIYQSILFNLDKQSQNPAQSHIIDFSTGSINYTKLQDNSKKVTEALKAKYPDKFIEINQEIKPQNKSVDFNNAEEVKKHFEDLYKGLSECKSREAKIDYIKNNFDISLENMSKKEQDEVINKFETRQKIREIKSTLDIDNIQKENPDLSEDELNQLLEDTAVEQYALENDKDIEIEKQTNDSMIELENTISDIERLNQDLLNCTDEAERVEIYNEISEISNSQNELIKTLAISESEIEKIVENSKQQNKNLLERTDTNETEDSIEFLDLFNENELDINDELADLFITEENEPAEDLAYLFDADIEDLEEKSELDEKINNEQPISENSQVFTNPILIGADENDLKQEDYTIEIDENKSLWNKIKNGLSKIKNSILEKLNLNQNKQLNGQAYLDTSENNTKSVVEDEEMQNTFDQSLQVSKEDQEKYKKEYETSKKSKSQSDILEVDKNSGQSIEV